MGEPALARPVHGVADGGLANGRVALGQYRLMEGIEVRLRDAVPACAQWAGDLREIGGDAGISTGTVMPDAVRFGAVQLGSGCRMRGAIELVALEPVVTNNVAG